MRELARTARRFLRQLLCVCRPRFERRYMGQGYTETGEKKERMEKKKRHERSAKHWILEGALFFHFSPPPPLSLSLLSLLLAPFRTTATSWQTGRYVPVRSALTSPFLSNLICRERRYESNFSPRRILDNSPSTIHPVCLRIVYPTEIFQFQIFSR